VQRYYIFLRYANLFLSLKGTIFSFSLVVFGWFHPNELTRISCELLRQLGDDEAAEGGIELLFGLRCGVRVDAEELRISTGKTLVGEFDVLVVLLLPKGETLGVVHFRFA